MAIDPRIPLQAQAPQMQQPDLLQSYATLAQIGNMQEQQAMRSLQRKQLEKEAEQEQKVSQLLEAFQQQQQQPPPQEGVPLNAIGPSPAPTGADPAAMGGDPAAPPSPPAPTGASMAATLAPPQKSYGENLVTQLLAQGGKRGQEVVKALREEEKTLRESNKLRFEQALKTNDLFGKISQGVLEVAAKDPSKLGEAYTNAKTYLRASLGEAADPIIANLPAQPNLTFLQQAVANSKEAKDLLVTKMEELQLLGPEEAKQAANKARLTEEAKTPALVERAGQTAAVELPYKVETAGQIAAVEAPYKIEVARQTGAIAGANQAAGQQRAAEIERQGRIDAARIGRTEKELGEAAQKEVAQLDTVLQMIDDVTTLHDPKFTGPLEGRAAVLREKVTGEMKPEETEMRRTLNDMVDLLTRERSGANIGEKTEITRLLGIVPTAELPDNVFKDRLQSFKRGVQQFRANRVKTATTSRKDLGEQAAPITPLAEKAAPGTAPAAPAKPAASTKQSDPLGIR